MSDPVLNTEHVSTGLKRLLVQFRGQPRIRGILSAYLTQVQELEVALFDLMVKRYLDSAEGAQLDGIGQILNVPRAGRTDPQYRVWLGARLLVLRSSGRTEQLLEILRRLLPDGTLVQETLEPPAAFLLDIVDPIDADLGNQLAQVIVPAKGGGIRLLLQWRRPGDTFKYSDTFGADTPASPTGYDAGDYSATSDGAFNVTFAP